MVSVKIGGPVFAKFSTDMTKFDIGVRVGVGVSDPTGGNAAGVDLSFGGRISDSGSGVDVQINKSAYLGTRTEDIRLFGVSTKF